MGVLPTGLYFVAGKYTDFERYCKWHFKDQHFQCWRSEIGKHPEGLHLKKPGYWSVIWLPRVPKKPNEIGVLAHEISHAVLRICEWAGIPITDDTSEIIAFMHGYLLECILKLK